MKRNHRARSSRVASKPASKLAVERIYSKIGQHVAELRVRDGMTQQALAERIGVARSQIANIEAGRSRLLFHTVVEFARVFRCTLSRLTGGR
jgi:DNA-binding XRE family transcriptional regulator